MKKIITLSAFFAIALASRAQTMVTPAAHAAHTDNTAPVSKTETATPPVDALAMKEAEYNFGKIPQGKPVTHVFEFTNTGKTPFKLDNVQASCGCTTPEWSKDKTIAPGETSVITVGYNAAAEGPFTKSITVTYNTNQTKVVLIKGEVWKTPSTSAPANTGLNDIKN
jgi:hypothetical protein